MEEKILTIRIPTYGNEEELYKELVEACNTRESVCPVAHFYCPFKDKQSCEDITIDDWKKIITFEK